MNAIRDADYIDLDEPIKVRKTTAFEQSQQTGIVFNGQRFIRSSGAATGSDSWNNFPLLNLNSLFTTRDMTADNLTAMYYRKNGLIFSLLGIRGRCLSQLRWKHYDDNDKEIPNSPFVALLNKPNPAHDARRFLTVNEIFGCHGGDTYMHVVRDRYEGIYQLYPYSISSVYPVSKPTEWITRYEFSNGVNKIPIPISDIIHVGWESTNLQFSFRSVSPLSVIAEELDIDTQRIGMAVSQLKNGGMPAFFLELSEKQLTDEAGNPLPLTLEYLQRIGQQINENFSVGKNRGRAAVIPNGTVPHFPNRNVPLTTHEYALMPETRGATIFGVPLLVTSLFSAKDVKTHANYEQAVKSLYRDTILPRAEVYGETISEFMRGNGTPENVGGVPFEGRLTLDYSHLQALQETIGDKTETAGDQFKAGFITLDEARSIVGREPIKDDRGGKFLWELQAETTEPTEPNAEV